LTIVDPEFKVDAHQLVEQVHDNIPYVTCFSGGLRALDISQSMQSERIGLQLSSTVKATMFFAVTMDCSI
jgi:hypothetical protein